MIFGRNTSFLFGITKGLGKSDCPEVLELGDGLLALRWSDDENFVIYFDTGRWKLNIAMEERYREVITLRQLANTGVITAYLLCHPMRVPQVVQIIVGIVLAPTAIHYKLVSEI